MAESRSMPVRATKRGDERTPLDGTYDVLICGASFAGLAVARELAGSGANVMVVDRYQIGERQTSACGIPTDWLRAAGLMEAERQRFGANRKQITINAHIRTRDPAKSFMRPEAALASAAGRGRGGGWRRRC